MKANATGNPTYGQSQGKEPVNWRREIRLAKRRKVKSPLNQRLTDLSVDWGTCAVGQQDARIIGNVYSSPFFDLGIRFCTNIDNEKWNDALNTLKEIEDTAQKELKKL